MHLQLNVPEERAITPHPELHGIRAALNVRGWPSNLIFLGGFLRSFHNEMPPHIPLVDTHRGQIFALKVISINLLSVKNRHSYLPKSVNCCIESGDGLNCE